MVTQTPLLFWPPALGPLSRSEKKMRGCACAHASAADSSKVSNEPIFKNLSIATPLGSFTKRICRLPISGDGNGNGDFRRGRTLRAAGIQRSNHVKVLFA